MTATAFPERLRQLRTARNLTQPQLADATKLGQSSISRWEMGEVEPVMTGGFWMVDLDDFEKCLRGEADPAG